ncbi:MAG: phosphoribosylaminoimidazolesuccinocarboxamide synthase [Calditrichaeota bacterium]|nr:phosphoribosylaminoimidazolesuccinocarboxamide synthase [Calditrichota bacterium]MCB0289935.1 phosphoribosylaminoimidazolesuccinocarboxamide synthase [Calditrichota bacterium]MCB0294077.1 phosphoribosylaminoimidazolesuccinocarboxamide synthase [Calditrichota bacterium]MCB0304395.1 phosphoribosylaminoimidazolesuccinocarboxamide synthase [Calditrichota bacterium]MCB0314091.1 phosphoribosylaminoimidazolesuccinocarboxamide synthase [Calditrichota bacterium]
MEIKELLVDGSTKKIYATNQSDQIIVAFIDADSKGKKKDTAEIAEINNAVSAFLFDYLESYNVPTHFSKKLDSKSFLARKMEMVPMVVSVYNIASGDLAERLGIESGRVLEYPIVEMYYKDDKRKLPMINEYHAYALGLCERKDMTSIQRIATKVNAVLKSFFDRRNLKLINFSLEFGRAHHQILLGDEMSLDSMNIWLVKEDGSFEQVPEGNQKRKEDYQKLKARILGEDKS